MIILNLKGGLGNVMFQYSLGRHLFLKYGSKLKFDIGSYKANPLGNYSFSLEAFNINIRDNLASKKDIKKLKKYRPKSGKISFFYNKLLADKSKYYYETGFDFDPKVLDLKDDVYIDGWWQNEKYFIDIRNVLLKDFTLKKPLSESNLKIAEKITSTQPVALHLRRLDYVTNPKTKTYHGELKKNYYKRGVKLISERVHNPTLFIFSDDIQWARENIQFPFETYYVSGNLHKPHEDMSLMNMCKHHIVANSSFSWWGAWLCTNPHQIVIAPEKWTNNITDKNERIPSSWIKIPNEV